MGKLLKTAFLISLSSIFFYPFCTEGKPRASASSIWELIYPTAERVLTSERYSRIPDVTGRRLVTVSDLQQLMFGMTTATTGSLMRSLAPDQKLYSLTSKLVNPQYTVFKPSAEHLNITPLEAIGFYNASFRTIVLKLESSLDFQSRILKAVTFKDLDTKVNTGNVDKMIESFLFITDQTDSILQDELLSASIIDAMLKYKYANPDRQPSPVGEAGIDEAITASTNLAAEKAIERAKILGNPKTMRQWISRAIFITTLKNTALTFQIVMQIHFKLIHEMISEAQIDYPEAFVLDGQAANRLGILEFLKDLAQTISDALKITTLSDDPYFQNRLTLKQTFTLLNTALDDYRVLPDTKFRNEMKEKLQLIERVIWEMYQKVRGDAEASETIFNLYVAVQKLKHSLSLPSQYSVDGTLALTASEALGDASTLPMVEKYFFNSTRFSQDLRTSGSNGTGHF